MGLSSQDDDSSLVSYLTLLTLLRLCANIHLRYTKQVYAQPKLQNDRCNRLIIFKQLQAETLNPSVSMVYPS